MQHVVIIGNGIAGITCARHVRQLSRDHQITVISDESDHFYSRTALMYIYMGHLKYEHTKPYEDGFWAKNRIDLKRGRVETVQTDARQLQLADGSFVGYDQLVIATGSRPTFFCWPGQHLAGVQGLYGLEDLDAMERNTQGVRQAVVVGGGLIGVEMAEMLLSRQIAVTLLVREQTYWSSVLPAEEGELIGRHLQRHGVALQTKTELRELLPDSSGRVRAVITTAGDELPAQFVGITIGVTPNVGFLTGSGVAVGRGVLVNEYFETNIPNVYAIGDCNEFREPVFGADGTPRKPNEQIWYTGRMHGETLAQTLCGQRTAYQPGVFFNSAKFFDIEYQTYGTLNARLAEGEQTVYWEAANGEQCLRINYQTDGQRVVGLHSFGLRLRHAVVERWIRERQPLNYVLARLHEANFNPEFADFVVAETGTNALRLDRSRNWLARLFA